MSSVNFGESAPLGEELLTVHNVKKYFPLTSGTVLRRTTGQVRAVDDVSFTLRKGETLGLVGESGCGKSTIAKLVAALTEPTSGVVKYKGRDVHKLNSGDTKRFRREVQLIFQDPYTSLNPRMTVGDIVTEAWEIHENVVAPKHRPRAAKELLERVGLNPDYLNRYPHQFSGGQRQRIGIARALALKPELIVCDEPVSALDVSVQAQVVNLLEDLQRDFGMSYLFIAHDLSVVRHLSDRIAVMYLGKIAEMGSHSDVYDTPAHPYTQALLSAVPTHDPLLRGRKERILLQGDVPSPAKPPSGCSFRTRCAKVQEICAQEEPPLAERDAGHPTACHFAQTREVMVKREHIASTRSVRPRQ